MNDVATSVQDREQTDEVAGRRKPESVLHAPIRAPRKQANEPLWNHEVKWHCISCIRRMTNEKQRERGERDELIYNSTLSTVSIYLSAPSRPNP